MVKKYFMWHVISFQKQITIFSKDKFIQDFVKLAVTLIDKKNGNAIIVMDNENYDNYRT